MNTKVTQDGSTYRLFNKETGEVYYEGPCISITFDYGPREASNKPIIDTGDDIHDAISRAISRKVKAQDIADPK